METSGTDARPCVSTHLIFPLRLSKFESAALTIELRGHYKDQKNKSVSTAAHLRGHNRSRQEPDHFLFSSIDGIPRCWGHRCPRGTRCLQGDPFFVLAPHMTRSTVSDLGSGLRAVKVSRADTVGVEEPAFD